jgi:hypothetical protein
MTAHRSRRWFQLSLKSLYQKFFPKGWKMPAEASRKKPSRLRERRWLGCRVAGCWPASHGTEGL